LNDLRNVFIIGYIQCHASASYPFFAQSKMSKAVLRGMMKKKAGRIISIASVVGATGNAD
jgi:NAD(P)-dependent dehydrogenase (short-subunit alcohol dehydrogenase family)